jgi:hypothetical protein
MNTENTRSRPHWHATESLLLRTRRHDVLFEGPVEATSAALLRCSRTSANRLSGSLLRRSSFLAVSQAR